MRTFANGIIENFVGDDPIEHVPPLPGRSGVLPEVCHLGWGKWPRAISGGYPPQAFDAYFVNYTVHGSTEWWVENETVETRAGDLYLLRPNELNGGFGSVMHPCECYWICFKFPQRKSGALPGLSAAETAALEASFRTMDCRLFDGTAQIADCFARLLAEQRHRQLDSVTIARGLFHQLLVLIVRAHHKGRRPSDDGRSVRPAVSGRMQRALALMEEHLSEPMTIESVARALGVSKRYFHQEFLRTTKMTPAEHLGKLRQARAKQLLRKSGLAITAIAHQLGYATSQHFSTVFKNMTGMTPKQFRSLRGGIPK